MIKKKTKARTIKNKKSITLTIKIKNIKVYRQHKTNLFLLFLQTLLHCVTKKKVYCHIYSLNIFVDEIIMKF